MNLGLQFQKTNVGTRINILKKLCIPIFKQTEIFDFFGQNLPNSLFWDQHSKNLIPNLESPPPRYHVSRFLGKTDNSEFFDPNLGKFPNYG